MKSFEVKSKWVKKLLMKYTKLYQDYLPVKDVFEEPHLRCQIGRWRRDNCLPVWRRGRIIRTFTNWNNVRQVFVEVPKKKWASRWDWKWTREFKRKHPIRSLLKPFYTLPIWLAFFKFNHGMFWKTKWEDYRYEFSPQFTLVFFGLSISFWLWQEGHDDYWEAILYYTDPAEMSGRAVYDGHLPEYKGDIVEVGKMLGAFSVMSDTVAKASERHYCLRGAWLKDKYAAEWCKYMLEHPLNEEPKKKVTRKKKVDGDKTTKTRKSTKKVDKKTTKQETQTTRKRSKKG